MNIEEVLGVQHSHLQEYSGVLLHRELIAPIKLLAQRAEKHGFDFAIASGYRSFERQLKIWNDKACGARPVLDDGGLALNIVDLSERELVFAILRWSALPGASRHHWGTDLDVYDAAPSKDGYKLQLTVEETVGGGIYAPFHRWLDEELKRGQIPFFRPYTALKGGVAPEPWHLSYAPLSLQYQKLQSKDAILNLLKSTDLVLSAVVFESFDEIYKRFILLPNFAGQ